MSDITGIDLTGVLEIRRDSGRGGHQAFWKTFHCELSVLVNSREVYMARKTGRMEIEEKQEKESPTSRSE